VVVRVANLPLVSSTYDLVSSVYVNTKENHPYLRSVCEVAEKGVKTIGAAAFTNAVPVIQKMESYIVIANNDGNIALDKVEEKLPILHQPSDKVVTIAKELVMGAKETVAHTIFGVVDQTKEAVHGSIEMAKSVVTGGVDTVFGSHVVPVVSSGIDAALTKSELFVDHYLPLTEDELAKESAEVEGYESGTPNYYLRLRSLLFRMCKHASWHALSRIGDAKQRSYEVITQILVTWCQIPQSQICQTADWGLEEQLIKWRKLLLLFLNFLA
ncbi:perilipin-2-like, partial [Latimeria chalumnae]|uniref:perilipin-2-like n=1 Tax=Latimeria chalumnae TaxID=7897 RepID=UPI00313CCFFD